jgi:glycosyltransferase involved in cell wall biosynthesis
MKVTLVNTYPHGGAGIACRRLEAALQTQGVTTQILFRDGNARKWPFYAERLSFLPYERDKSVRFSFSLANFGTDLRQHPDIQSADVIHLHWVNQGFLSLQNVRQLAELGKPIFWTLHDMWAFTGGCHYARGCTHFLQSCGQCAFVKNPSEHDLSHRIWLKKQDNFPKNIHFITCSQWLQQAAQSSSLLRHHRIDALPNPIDTQVFLPTPEAQRQLRRQALGIAPDAQVLLFVAMKVSETRKGFHHLLVALQHLKSSHPGQPFEILVLGKAEPEALQQLPYPTHALGMVTAADELAAWYGTADLFIIPSLEDNLPNTVMESLACGTPVVGFQTGGIPEMVEHGQQGAIVPQGDAKGLAQSIHDLCSQPQKLSALRTAARHKVESCYSLEVIGQRHLDLYRAGAQ